MAITEVPLTSSIDVTAPAVVVTASEVSDLGVEIK